MFNTPKNLDPQVIRAYNEFCAAFSVASLANAKMPPILQEGMSPQQSMNLFLSAIGLSGKEFETSRSILSRNLSEKVVLPEQLSTYMEKYTRYEHGREIETSETTKNTSEPKVQNDAPHTYHPMNEVFEELFPGLRFDFGADYDPKDAFTAQYSPTSTDLNHDTDDKASWDKDDKGF